MAPPCREYRPSALLRLVRNAPSVPNTSYSLNGLKPLLPPARAKCAKSSVLIANALELERERKKRTLDRKRKAPSAHAIGEHKAKVRDFLEERGKVAPR